MTLMRMRDPSPPKRNPDQNLPVVPFSASGTCGWDTGREMYERMIRILAIGWKSSSSEARLCSALELYRHSSHHALPTKDLRSSQGGRKKRGKTKKEITSHASTRLSSQKNRITQRRERRRRRDKRERDDKKKGRERKLRCR